MCFAEWAIIGACGCCGTGAGVLKRQRQTQPDGETEEWLRGWQEELPGRIGCRIFTELPGGRKTP